MAIKIIEYRLGWSPKQGRGGIELKTEDGRRTVLQVSTLADLAGWAALCKESPLYLHQDGTVMTSQEPIA